MTITEEEIKEKTNQWGLDVDKIEQVIQGVKKDGRKQLLEGECREILGYADIPMAEGGIGQSYEECLEIADDLDYPVVMKVVSEDIVHKMDVGGIAVDQVVAEGGETVDAEMQGTILSVDVGEGDEVAAGDVLCVLEAMKMENDVVAERGGTVTQVLVGEGESVDMGDTLFVLE